MENKIPKKIHYCWFGENPLSEEAKKCISSWRKFMPDYEIIEWNETNYDIEKIPFVKEAYRGKKWAFVTDVVRLDVIYNYGGIYFDTDVEVLRTFDDLLNTDLFLGFDDDNLISTGLGFGAKPYHPIVLENLNEYKKIENIYEDGVLNLVTCPYITSKVLKTYGFKMNNKLQRHDGAILFPKDYFCPLNFYDGKLTITENSYSIHHSSMSWLSEYDKKWHKRQQYLGRLIGKEGARVLANGTKFICQLITSIKRDGLTKTKKLFIMKVNKYKNSKK